MQLLILIILNSSFLFAQFYSDTTISVNIVELVKIAEEYSNNERQENINEEELKNIVRLHFYVYENEPVSFINYMEKKHKEWENRILKSNKKSKELRPWLKIYNLQKQISAKYGFKFKEIIVTPAKLRLKYIKKYKSVYEGPDVGKFSQDNFSFLIEDILKGNKFFIIGDTITISMIPNVESPAPKFATGKSYLVPLRPRVGNDMYNGELAFNYLHEHYDRWIMGKPPKTFPIENEIIKDCEYFGINDTNWIDFKKYFSGKFIYLECE